MVIPLKPRDFANATGGPRLAARLFVAALAAGLVTACGTTSSSSSSSSATSSASVSPRASTSQPSTEPTNDVRVPPLIGASEGEARRQLARDGFGRVMVSLAPNNEFTSNTVTATSPPGNNLTSLAATVILYVSQGPQIAPASCSAQCISSKFSVTMPDVCGLTFQEAAAKLSAKDITLLPPLRGDLDPPGRVTSSVPAANQRFIAYGSTSARSVTVILSTALSASAVPSC